MRANTDRAPGVHLVTDPVGRVVATPVAPVEDVDHLDFEVDVPEIEVVALKGRITSGLGVQLLAERKDKGGRAWITLTLDGETETFEVPPSAALDAFEHPFAYGGSLL